MFELISISFHQVTGAAFHPLDDNLMITHGKGHLTFWTRRKDGFFERTDIIKPVKTLSRRPKSSIVFLLDPLGFSL